MRISFRINEKRELCKRIVQAYQKKEVDCKGTVIQKTINVPVMVQRGYYTSAIAMPSTISKDAVSECREEAKKFERLADSKLLYLVTKSSLEKVLDELQHNAISSQTRFAVEGGSSPWKHILTICS